MLGRTSDLLQSKHRSIVRQGSQKYNIKICIPAVVATDHSLFQRVFDRISDLPRSQAGCEILSRFLEECVDGVE